MQTSKQLAMQIEEILIYCSDMDVTTVIMVVSDAIFERDREIARLRERIAELGGYSD